MVYQDLLNQELGQNLLDRTHIEVEEVISVQTQHQYMDQFIKLILIMHTQEVTLVFYHKQLLKTNLSFVSES